MRKKDSLTKLFLSQEDVFADAFNYLLFGGEAIIKPEDLTEQDPTEIAEIRKLGKIFTDQKYRDVLKLCTIRRSKYATLVLLGIEGQANIHYAMPVRDMLYDALNYHAQVETARRRHEGNHDLAGAELLSGFSRSDRLVTADTAVPVSRTMTPTSPTNVGSEKRMLSCLSGVMKRFAKMQSTSPESAAATMPS